MPSSPSKTPTYRPDIDGLRAIAVLSVLFFHADIGFPGGFVGVDVFFVISGYLITGLILNDLNGGRFSLRGFWERRVRRILPALTLVVIASLVAGWFLFLPPDLKALGRSVFAQAALASNLNFWLEAGYFDQAAEFKPLLHTWSLAVEEQFYLLFPLLLVALHRLSRTSIPRVILLLSLISFALSVYCSYHHSGANFYLLPTRAWELLIGSFLAAIPAQRTTPRWITESLSASGLLAILTAIFLYDRTTRFPGLTALPPCLGTALIIWGSTTAPTSTGRLLAARPLVFIGLISYSLYLWHWPLLVFTRYLTIDPLSAGQRTLLLLASLLLATLSWKWVELPFRRRLILRSRVQTFTFAGITIALFLPLGLALYITKGLPSRFPPAALRYSNTTTTDFQFVQDMSYRIGLPEAQSGDLIELGTGDTHQPIHLLVWGDSHAAAILPIIDTLCKERSLRAVAAVHAVTAPLVGYTSTRPVSLREQSIAYNDAITRLIRTHHIRHVLLVAKWAEYITDSGPAQIRSSLLKTLTTLQQEPAAAPSIYLLRQVPKPRWHVPRTLDVATQHGRLPSDLGIPLADHLQEFQRQTPCFQDLPHLTLLDPTPLFLNPQKADHCLVESNGHALFSDDSHLTTTGATLLKPLLIPIFQKEASLPITPPRR